MWSIVVGLICSEIPREVGSDLPESESGRRSTPCATLLVSAVNPIKITSCLCGICIYLDDPILLYFGDNYLYIYIIIH